MKETTSRKNPTQLELDFQETITRGDGSSRPQSKDVMIEGLSASALYWRTVLITTLIVLGGGTLTIWANNPTTNFMLVMVRIAFVMAMVYPGVQFIAGIASLVIAASGGKERMLSDQYRQLNRINLGMIGGSLLGLFATVVLLILMK